VVAALAAVVAVGAAAGTPPAAGATATDVDDLFAVVAEPDGGLTVVEGMEAVEVAYDAALGRTDAEVLSIEQDAPVSSLGTNDPLRGLQWALDRTSFEATWPTTRGQGVTVAVVDTGVRGDHEDLAANLVPGTDLVLGAGDGRIDPAGHGTHVAGIVGALAGNGRGIAGGAPGVRIMPIRVLDENGSGYSSDVAAGIIWAVDHGARVINLSLGGPSPSSGQLNAIRYAISKGAVVVAAAGNSGGSVVYPAAFDEVIAVSAVGSNLALTGWSSRGPQVDLTAPGDGIASSYSGHPAQYGYMSGTSMATPYVSAAAALVVAANPKNPPAKVREALEASAKDLGAPGKDWWYGSGLVDPRAAVNRALPPIGGSSGKGYWVVGAEGRVQAFGAARHYGDLAGRALSAPIVAAAPTRTGNGYWLAGADGAVYTFGDARFHGSMAGRGLNARIVGMSATPTGNGYHLLGADGGVFSFGDAKFYGSTGGMRLNAPVLDMTLSPTGRGYWFVGADGGIFSFGDARFRGSTGGMALAAPVVSMTAAQDGRGYWMIARDGGVFAFPSTLPFHGSLPGLKALYGLSSVPAGLRVRALPDGTGYYILGADGAVFAFGQAKFHGSATGTFPVDLMLVP
jgi:type VII secretion-associated serine protease mycosin